MQSLVQKPLRESRSRLANAFLSPAVLICILIWIANDALGKKFWPGFITGKLSDGASLFAFPLFLAWLAAKSRKALNAGFLDYRAERRILAASLFFTGAIFTAINLDQNMNDWFTGIFWGALLQDGVQRGTADPTDLIALLACPLAYLYARRRMNQKVRSARRFSRRLGAFAMVALCLGASLNTSRNIPPGDGEILFFFVTSGINDGRVYLETPGADEILAASSTQTFRWFYQGYFDRDPSFLNQGNVCGGSGKSGGIFNRYVVQIAPNADFSVISLSLGATNPETTVTVNLPPGQYYWRAALEFLNHSGCSNSTHLREDLSETRRFLVN